MYSLLPRLQVHWIRADYNLAEVDIDIDGRARTRRPVGLTQKDNMHTPLIKLVETLFPLCDIAMICIVDRDLTTLDGKEIPYLIFELRLDSFAEGVGFRGPFSHW